MYQQWPCNHIQLPSLKDFVCLCLVSAILNCTFTQTDGAEVEVYFSPDGGATNAITSEINRAQHEILIQAYTFSSVPVASALVAAKRRGIKVEAVLDKSNIKERYSVITFLENSDIPIYIDDRVKIAHSKIIIIDQMEVITGSFNFTTAAEYHNAENLLILKNDPALIGKYIANYRWRLSLSRLVSGPGGE